ncbi:PPE-repeat protein [Rhodococcus sp. 27YEA15]|uniref:PPE domain-containing protein n=1 Tax=Rhodococcus sp. 27YEA15 TaxID=3156259 RepID=UPI003C7C4322
MVGITGVVWYPRGAAPNSSSLIAGAGAVPLTVAAGSWTAVATALGESAATVSRVMAHLGEGWSGEAADVALSTFAPFQAWAAKSSVLASETATKAQVQAGSYTLAVLAMPTLVEIAAARAATVAAISAAGVLPGAIAVAEAAEEAVKIRAAVAMETYDAATTPLAVPRTFDSPPAIARDQGNSLPGSGRGDDSPLARSNSVVTLADAIADPVRAASAAISSTAAGPAIGAAASAATSAAATMGTTVTSAAGAAAGIGGLSAAASPLFGRHHGHVTAGVVAAAPSSNGRHASGSSPATTVSASLGSGNLGGGRHALGGAATQIHAPLAPSAVQPNSVSGGAAASLDSARLDTARPGMGGMPMAAGRHARTEEDETHDLPDYLKHFEHFADGRTVIPSVIGGAPESVR